MASEDTSAVGLGTAAKMVSRGQTTIRDWIKSGVIKANRNNLGHWTIERDSLLAYASSEGSDRGPRRVVGAAAHSPHILAETRFEALSAALKSEIEHLKLLLREERERNKTLEQERTQHLAEMRALLEKQTGLMGWVRGTVFDRKRS